MDSLKTVPAGGLLPPVVCRGVEIDYLCVDLSPKDVPREDRWARAKSVLKDR